MKKSVLMKLGVVVLAAAIISGCQMGATDEALINTTMGKWKEALIAQDLDKLMETYSEDYVSDRGGGKEATREFIEGAFEQGWLDNIEIDIEAAELAIEEDKAEFASVELVTDNWDGTIYFTLQKEEGNWLIVASENDTD